MPPPSGGVGEICTSYKYGVAALPLPLQPHCFPSRMMTARDRVLTLFYWITNCWCFCTWQGACTVVNTEEIIIEWTFPVLYGILLMHPANVCGRCCPRDSIKSHRKQAIPLKPHTSALQGLDWNPGPEPHGLPFSCAASTTYLWFKTVKFKTE